MDMPPPPPAHHMPPPPPHMRPEGPFEGFEGRPPRDEFALMWMQPENFIEAQIGPHHGPRGPRRNLKKKDCGKKKNGPKKEGKEDSKDEKKHHKGGKKHCKFGKCIFGLIFMFWGFLNFVAYYYHFGMLKCLKTQIQDLPKP